jgi:hypothetical protein
MREKAIILERSIQSDLATIADIYAKINIQAMDNADENSLIVLAYRFHSLYSAFENIFYQIAKTFENQLDVEAGWHSQLLQRMRLDLMPIRPSVIDETAYKCLDELRRFRHLFRSAYGVDLDPQRLQLVLNKALELRAIYSQQIAALLNFLQTLQ